MQTMTTVRGITLNFKGKKAEIDRLTRIIYIAARIPQMKKEYMGVHGDPQSEKAYISTQLFGEVGVNGNREQFNTELDEWLKALSAKTITPDDLSPMAEFVTNFRDKWIIVDDKRRTAEQEAAQRAKWAQEAEERKKEAEQAEAFYNLKGSDLEAKQADKNATVVNIIAVCDNSDIMTDYFDRHHHLSGAYLCAVYPKGQCREEKAQAVVSGHEDLRKLTWKWDSDRRTLESSVVGHNPEGKPYWYELEVTNYRTGTTPSRFFTETTAAPVTVSEDGKNFGDVHIAQYSEKAIVVYGDTRPIKDDLRKMGGRWNARLHLNGQHIMGWVFPTAKLDAVTAYLESK